MKEVDKVVWNTSSKPFVWIEQDCEYFTMPGRGICENAFPLMARALEVWNAANKDYAEEKIVYVTQAALNAVWNELRCLHKGFFTTGPEPVTLAGIHNLICLIRDQKE